MENNNPNYYAIIPANVRYDKDLTANAKLLYGEITALCNSKGYCWATNEYFAELYGVANETISRWVSSLVKKGYLISKIKFKNGTKEIESRLLKIVTPIDDFVNTSPQKDQYPIDDFVNTSPQKDQYPIDENVKENNTINNTNEYNKGNARISSPKDEFLNDCFIACKKFFLQELHPGWKFNATQGSALKAMIKNIKADIEKNGTIGTVENVTGMFKIICENLPDWYRDKNLNVINGAYNTIIEQIKNIKNGTDSSRKSSRNDVFATSIFARR